MPSTLFCCQYPIASRICYPSCPNCETAWLVVGLGSAILIALWILFLSNQRQPVDDTTKEGDDEP